MTLSATLPARGGQTGAAIRAGDWSSSRLGPYEAWPATLRVALDLVLNSPESLFLAWGPDLLFFFNDACRPILGPRADSLLGVPVARLWPNLWERVRPYADEALAGRPSRCEDFPLEMARRGGRETTWWSFSFSPVQEETGAVAGLLCVAHETTPRVRNETLAQEALRQADARLRHAQEAGGVGVFSIEIGDNLIRGTPEFCRIFGLAESELIPAELVERMVASEHLHLVSNARTRAEGDGPLDVEYRIRRPDTGEERWIARKGEYEHDAEGRPIRLVGVVQDVTERRAAQKALEESAAKLAELNATLEARIEEQARERERIWRNSRDLLAVIGGDGVFRAVNPAWKAILGHEPEAVVGRSFREFVWPEDLEASQEALRAALLSSLTNVENRLVRLDGRPEWFSWRTSHEGDLVYAYGRHITAEKRQAEALAEAEAQLRHSQKLEAVGQLTGGVAHDFNNLLMAVMGNLDLLKRRLDQGRSDVGGLADNAIAAAGRAASLTRRLLAFARRQPLVSQRVEVDALIEGLVPMMRTTVGDRIALALEVEPGLWPAFCDPHQLDNALLNLVINARDAMPDGGQVAISARNCVLGDGEARPPLACPAGDYVRVGVRDTGVGMTAEVAAKAFDPFFTTKPVGQGTGLGLSMLYGFVQQSGGSVWIESAPGEGAEVILLLPRARQPEEEGAEDAAGTGAAGSGQTVLLVEDEPLIRAVMVETLVERGYVCRAAADAEEALAAAGEAGPIHLLVSDVALPGGLDGVRLAGRVRERRPDLKVILISGHAEAGPGWPALEGAELLAKPFDMDTLLRRIAAALAVAPRG